MNSKYVTIALVVIIVCASAIGYLAYNGTFSANSNASPSPTASPTPEPTAIPVPVDFRVFIASSLTNVVANMTQAFDKANNCNIIVNSASSSALYTQITAGSPCDVFMSADIKWIKQLNSSGLLYGNYYTNFTSNSLAIIVAAGNPKGITSLTDIVKPGVKIVVADPTIPVGSYTNTTLAKIDATWGSVSSPQYVQSSAYVNYNATFAKNIVSYEESDEEVVGKVSLNLGSADAGIVFVSDAVYGNMTGSQVQFLPIDPAVNTVGTYGIAVVGGTTQSAVAQQFMNYWLSSDGQALLKEFGFGS